MASGGGEVISIEYSQYSMAMILALPIALTFPVDMQISVVQNPQYRKFYI